MKFLPEKEILYLTLKKRLLDGLTIRPVTSIHDDRPFIHNINATLAQTVTLSKSLVSPSLDIISCTEKGIDMI